MCRLVMQFPNKDFRLSQDVMNISELWKALADFTGRRHDDNVAMSEDGKTYPLSTRHIQMRSFSALSECLVSTHNAMQEAANCYKAAFGTGFTGEVVRSFLSELTDEEKKTASTIRTKLFQKIHSADPSWSKLFSLDFEHAKSAKPVLSALNTLAANLDMIRDNYSYF